MKASELMIGDWVRPLRKNLHGIPGQIITIDGGTNVCWIDCEDYSCLVSCSDVERIPLTSEILKKNGFDGGEESGVFYCKCGDIIVYVGIYHPDFVIVNYQYSTQEGDDTGEIADICKVDGADIMLHELQHTFRLLGIDKELRP